MNRLRGLETAEWMARARVSPREIGLMTRQLAGLLNAGVNLSRALQALTEQSVQPVLTEVLYTVEQSIRQGSYLSQAVARFPRVFPPVYVAMLRVGERTGGLVLCLERLAEWLDRDDRVRRRVAAALAYPLFVLGLSMLLTLALFCWVLPPFLGMLVGMNIPLPLVTRLMVGLVDCLRNPFCWLICLGAGWLLWQSARSWSWLGVPVVGDTLRCLCVVRFCSAAEAQLRSGGEMLLAWTLAGEATGHPLYRDDARLLVEHLKAGGDVADHLARRRDLYPPGLVHLARAGQETARLGEALARVRVLYESEIDYRVEVLGALLQPLMLGLISFIMIFTMTSIFLPLYAYMGSL